jgi:hypothetical protein
MKGLQATRSTTTGARGNQLHDRDKDYILMAMPDHCIWANYKSARLSVSNTVETLDKMCLGPHDLKQRSYTKPYANLSVHEHFASALLLLPHQRVTRRMCLGQVLLN